jgi:hypothetical protein
MKIPRGIAILMLPALLFACPGTARAAEFAAAFLTGYNAGLGFQLNAIVSQFAEGFPFKAKSALAISPGIDYFFPGALSGHDTSYSPNGENINPRYGFSYADADRAIHQPKLVPRFLVGFAFRYGR